MTSLHSSHASFSVLERIVLEFERRLLSGNWRDIARLPPERALAAEYAVSRATVREAIQRLVSRGLLETRRGSGVFVVKRPPARLAAPWLQVIDEHPPLRADTLEFRLVFECATARFAAERASAEEREKIGSIVARMEDAVGSHDLEAEAAADAEFHMMLAAASHNRMLDHLYSSVIAMLREHITRNTYDATLDHEHAAERARTRLAQHQRICEAILRCAADDASRAMYAHLEFVGSQFDRH